jgi:hypothetical protein
MILSIANAASIDKRAISAPTRLCIDSLNTVTTQYEILKYSVSIPLFKMIVWCITYFEYTINWLG